jgi:hypothetical protein|eukprot:Tamp_22972.p1 GENE.Tamp_22972~~Tamp_22972.p1  ORF type:complete len:131 (-),score=3.95 Tamp_22972:133-525(-)
METVAHIQSAGCKARKESVVQAHHSCWKLLLRAIRKHGEETREFTFIGEDKDKQLATLWQDAEIQKFAPRDIVEEAAERFMATDREENGEDPEVCRDDPYADVRVSTDTVCRGRYNIFTTPLSYPTIVVV